MAIERHTSKGQLVPLVFMQDDVAASQSNVQLVVAETEDATTTSTNSVDELTVPWDGEVVGVSAELSAAATAGTLDIGATINGTEDADTTFQITTATSAYKRVLREKARFVAGDRIGVEITTSAAWDGTTSDLAVVVWVLVQLEGI